MALYTVALIRLCLNVFIVILCISHFCFRMIRVLILLGVLATLYAHPEPVVVTNTWNGGFQGHFKITPDHAKHGWEAHMIFDQPVQSLEVRSTFYAPRTVSAEHIVATLSVRLSARHTSRLMELFPLFKNLVFEHNVNDI